MYRWLLEAQAEMEPVWSVMKIRLIFADGFLTDKLLEQLGITYGCVHHIMNEIWPQDINFGKIHFKTLRPFLQKMLLSKSEDEWTYTYTHARNIIAGEPVLVDKFEDISRNPSYYAFYYLENIQCNLWIKGSGPAKINHYSIIKYFGPSASWAITEHSVSLMER